MFVAAFTFIETNDRIRPMAKQIRLKRGYDLRLVGEAVKETGSFEAPKTYAIKPTDFKGIIPKLAVEAGTEVKAGTPLFYSKLQPEIQFTSPVSGEVVEVVRGEKRVILEIRILADSQQNYVQFGAASPSSLSVGEIKKKLLDSGAWAFIKQRPFNRVADVNAAPKNIFISGFDSNPLAPDLGYALKGRETHLSAGIAALKKLTSGKVFLSLCQGADNTVFETAGKEAEITYFNGPHPAGNVGVQIHHLAPINKGDVVWTVNAQDLATIGQLFTDGIFNPVRVITLAGSEVKNPKYFQVRVGSCAETLLSGMLNEGKNRIISGSVLFGDKIEAKGYLGFFDQQVTVIPEGDEPEFFGWLVPSYSRPSLSKTFLSYLTPNKKFRVNTSTHGEERAFVMTNEYEKVLPMDILPVQLLKACMAGDLESMEALGIYELAEEDLALCEFVCTSKIPVQEILSEGLALIEKEG